MSLVNPQLTLQIIITLDSLCYGLLYAFLPPYLLKLGADHLNLGLLSVGILTADLLSKDVANLFTHIHGKKFTLFLVFNIAAITHILLILTGSYWFTILVRILFSLTNQSQEICKNLLIETAQMEEEKQNLLYTSGILSASGYIVGPIISGYLFDYSYAYSGILAAILTGINTFLLFHIPRINGDENPEHSEKSVLNKAVEKVNDSIALLFSADINNNWDLVAIKYCFSASVAIFFSKFTQILKHNYGVSSVTIGYTAAYINLLVFICTFYIPRFREKYRQYPTDLLAEISFLILGLSTLFACYAPVYEFFMLMLIPTILARTYLGTLWKELYQQRQNDSLNELNNSVSVASGLLTPILFGITCNNIQHHAVVLFSVVPVLSSFYIVNKYTRTDKKIKNT